MIDQHMTVNPAMLSKDSFTAENTTSGVHHSLRYLPIDELQRDFPSATLPDKHVRQQVDADMLNMPILSPYQQSQTPTLFALT